MVGEGWHERPGGPHAEIVALEAAGEPRAGRDALRHARAVRPPRADAAVRRRAGRGRGGPRRGGGRRPEPADERHRLRAAPGGRRIEVDLPGGELEWRARVQNEAYRVWVAERRPFVVYKAAVTLDGRVTVPGSRWVTGEQSRRLVHELRATIGRGRGRDGHRARRQPAAHGPRRRRRASAAPARLRPRAAAGGLGARAPQRAARRGARAPGRRGVQSLLLEGARRSPPPSSGPAWSTS